MSSPRHRAALARPAARTWFRKILGPAVVSTSLTAMVVGVGVAGVNAESSNDDNLASSLSGAAGAALSGADLDALQARGDDRASRTAKRVTLEPQATDRKWATAPLNVWTGPGEKYKRVGLVEEGTRLAVTGQVQGHWAEILLKGDKVRWVNNDYLADEKPKPEPTTSATSSGGGGISGAPCPDGSSIESGLTTNADILYRAVCAAFPQPTSYGGYDPHGEHVDGRAIDIMISGDVGWQIANWLRANASALKIRDIIYAQRIWTPERAAEGWRYMSDRGSVTANHYDHVHVAVY